MALNLIRDAWVPVCRRDGTRAVIAPHEITDRNILRVDWPRTDFRLAQYEFLIGLLATAYPPADDDAWFALWDQPPSVETLTAALAPYACAFNVDGDGPRFLQDHDVALTGDMSSPETLLLDTPGQITIDKNRDFMVRRDRYRHLSRAAAAIALYTQQSYAPQGGSGHRMSVRDGAPLTTLVLPGGDPSLWHTLWANVPVGQPAPLNADVFPWLAPTRVSPNGEQTTEADAHKQQCWWGMPRRIRLVCETASDGACCDLTGSTDTVLVTGRVQVKHGVNYAAWMHPLTPYRQITNGAWRARQPDSAVGYRHWAALVTGSETERPAAAVSAWRRRVVDLDNTTREQTRLLYAGFECRQATAQAFVESEMPMPGSADVLTERAVAYLARQLITATADVEKALRRALGRSLFREADKLWQMTEPRFFHHLHVAPLPPGTPIEQKLTEVAADWLATLRQAALRIFDTARPLTDPNTVNPARIVGDRRSLTASLHGYGAGGKHLFSALLLSLPKGSR